MNYDVKRVAFECIHVEQHLIAMYQMLCPLNISLHVAMLSMCIHPTSLKSLQQSTTLSTCFTRNMIKTLQATLISLMIKWAWKTSKDLKALDSVVKKESHVETTSC